MRLLVLFFLVCCTLSFSQNFGHWEFTDSMQYGRWEHSSTVLGNGNVLVAGGSGGVSEYTAEIYDINSHKWVTAASLLDYLAAYSLFSVGNNKAIAFGQYRRKSCVIYDANLNLWYETDSLDFHRFSYSAVKLNNGKILVTGGSYFTAPPPILLSSCELFDPQTETWSYIDSMLIPRMNHSAVTLLDGRVMVIGGEITQEGYRTKSCEIYDPIANEWVFADSLPEPKSGTTAVTLPNGDIFISGGGGQTSLCYLYEFKTKSWRTAGYLYQYRTAHSVIPLSDSLVLLVGGLESSIETSWEVFNPYQALTLHHDIFPFSIFGSSVHKLSNSTLIKIGGFTDHNGFLEPRKECMIFYPKTTGLVTTDNALLEGFKLEQNYPNPFNPVTKIKYEIPEVTLRQHFDKLSVAAQSDRLVQLKVYDVLGNEVATIVNEYKPAGSYEVEFKGDGLTSGVYFYKLQAGNYLATKKMLLLK